MNKNSVFDDKDYLISFLDAKNRHAYCINWLTDTRNQTNDKKQNHLTSVSYITSLIQIELKRKAQRLNLSEYDCNVAKHLIKDGTVRHALEFLGAKKNEGESYYTIPKELTDDKKLTDCMKICKITNKNFSENFPINGCFHIEVDDCFSDYLAKTIIEYKLDTVKTITVIKTYNGLLIVTPSADIQKKLKTKFLSLVNNY